MRKHMEKQKGIQTTLFDYFNDTEYFTIQEANDLVLEHQKRDVNASSIRARIYEGIEKGLFERVGKGLYTVTRKDDAGHENTCLLINGDGRDLSIFEDNSLDAIITDHPYQLNSSLKGGNRNFADYDLFKYTEKDFFEKQRVLKPGCFLVEFLPEENGENYQYLYQVKEYARKAGLDYYAKVAWKKGDFVANTGRKSKNTEDVCFFTKGKARNLRPDAKKNKANPETEHYMSGAAGMLPTVFDVDPLAKKDKIHQAEKPVKLLEQILKFVTQEGELVLDQFAGSGVLGEAALNTHRDSILIEKDEKTYENIKRRLDKDKTAATSIRKVLDCSIRGDRRYCALFAKVMIHGKEKSIEEWYQNAKRTIDGKKAGKDKPFSYIIDPYTGNALPASDAEDLYCGLWIAYFNKHPEVVQYAEQFDDFADNYKNADDREISNVDVIQAYIKGNRGALVSDVKTGHWYTNLLRSKKERSVRSVADYAREFGKLSAKKNMEREN